VDVRNVRVNDIDDFVRLYSEAYRGLEEYAYRRERDIKRYFKWLLSRDPDGFYLAEINKPVGVIACDANWFSWLENEIVGEIHELFVHPNYRMKGIGSMLVKKAVKYVESRNRETAGLWVGVKNYGAKEFYRRLGFRETATLGKWTRMIKRI